MVGDVGKRRAPTGHMFTNTRHHSLIAWQRADDLFIKLHLLTLKHFPAFEKFELGSQLRKAACSVAANIVEGFARRSGKSRLNFLNRAPPRRHQRRLGWRIGKGSERRGRAAGRPRALDQGGRCNRCSVRCERGCSCELVSSVTGRPALPAYCSTRTATMVALLRFRI